MSLSGKLGEGGPSNLLILDRLENSMRPTNQGVGSSNLSGRATLAKRHSFVCVGPQTDVRPACNKTYIARAIWRLTTKLSGKGKLAWLLRMQRHDGLPLSVCSDLLGVARTSSKVLFKIDVQLGKS